MAAGSTDHEWCDACPAPAGSSTSRLGIANPFGLEQTDFVASNVFSLAQAAYQRQPHLIPLGVYDSDTMVGFVMYADPASPPDELGRTWIYRVMIGQDYQGKGYGRAAMVALLDRMRAATPPPRLIALDFHEDNHVAAQLYESLGFERTGEQEGHEVVAMLDLTKGSS
jgi:diamine N-acetyltransferase